MPKSLILVGDYSDLQSQGTVRWYDDDFTTPGTTQGLATTLSYLTRPGRRIGNVFVGDSQGRIFEEDTTDTVPFTGESIIVPGHLLMGDPGGADDEGKKLVRCWSFVESENSGWTFRVWTGDERAYPPFDAMNWIRLVKPGGESIAASKQTGMLGAMNTVTQAKSVHIHQPEKETAGRGFTFEYRFLNPLAVRFYGFGGVVEPGRTRRPIVEATP